MEENFDTILTQLGTGKWNMFYYCILAYWYACVCYHTLGGAFLAPEVDHTCHLPDTAFKPTLILPTTATESVQNDRNFTFYETSNGTASKETNSCTFYEHDNATDEIREGECDSWDFDNSTFESTITSEFGLVCNREYLRATYQSIYMFGILVGAGINGYLADKFGRQRMVMIGATCYSVIAVGSVWLPTISAILAARFFLGTMHPTSLQTGYILAMEVTEPKHRILVGCTQFTSWTIATSLWGAWAYLIRDWRWLQLTVSLPCLFVLPFFWIMDESPRWLIVTGRHKDALKVLQKAAKWNNADLHSEEKLLNIMKATHEESDHSEADEEETSLQTKLKRILQEGIILFRTPRLRIITLVMLVDYFVVAMVFFGLNLSGGSFDVNPFLYMVIAGIAELPSCFIPIPLLSRFGNKKPLILFYFICGVSMLTQPMIPTEYNWLLITVAMIGKLSISMVFQILFLYGTELFPTEVRIRGMGAAMMSSRAGAMIAPFLMSFIGSQYPWTTPVVFGVASVLAGLASLPVYETLNTVLPDTIVDLEKRGS